MFRWRPAIGLGLLQLVPLNRETNALLSPSVARIRAILLGTAASADDSLAERLGMAALAEHQPLSLYPASTRQDLAMLTLAAAVFVLGSVFFQTPRAQLWLCSLLAVNGAALAFFGFVQQLTWQGLLYGNIPLLGGGAPFGPFVNRNNAGGFLNLCLAGAVGMTIWAVGRHGSRGLDTMQFPVQHCGFLNRVGYRLQQFVLHLNATTVLAVVLTACIIAGIFCSLSRGAFFAMIGATAITALVVSCAQRRVVGGWYFAVIAAAGLGLVSWVGMSDSVKSRLATPAEPGDPGTRAGFHTGRTVLKAVPDFWRLGSGLGTYRYVYCPYQQQPCDVWFYHAENQYLETLVEYGLPGLALLLTMIALVAVAGWRLLRDAGTRRTRAFAIAGLFALIGQMIANSFDLGLYAAANMVLLALWCGALSGGAADLADYQGRSRLVALPRSRIDWCVGGCCTAGGQRVELPGNLAGGHGGGRLERDRLRAKPHRVLAADRREQD